MTRCSLEYYRTATLWATAASLISTGGRASRGDLSTVIVNVSLPALACVLNSLRMRLVREVYAWSITSRVAGVKCAQFQQQKLLRNGAVRLGDVRNESFFVVEQDICLQRSLIEESDSKARAAAWNARFVGIGACLLLNALAFGLFWGVRPVVLAWLLAHMLLTLRASLVPAYVLPEGDIGANASAVALAPGFAGERFALPVACAAVCLAASCAPVAAAARGVLALLHVGSTTLFQLRRPASMPHATFALVVIYAVASAN
jgi:hypothetical protein